MENEDQREIQDPDNHGGVRLCHKCGWPFPNPHPSPRHRRAHKRVCGKIEGHKLIDSEGSNHSTISDDEHVSDDGNPIIVESVKTEKGIDESEEKLKRSEEDVFSDAVADFSDGKLAGKTKDSSSISEMENKEELTSFQSFKDCEISDLAQWSSTLTDEIQLEAGEENTGSQQILNFPTDVCIDRENMDSQSNDVDAETKHPELEIEEIIERASDPTPAKEVVRLKEEHSACIDPYEVAAKSCSSDHLVESSYGGEEDPSKNVHTVSEPENTGTIDASEMKFIDSDNPKQEQEISEDALHQGFDMIDVRDENPDTEIEEMKSLEEEHLPIMKPENLKPSLGSANNESSIPCSATVEDNISTDVGGAVLVSKPLPVEDNIIDKPVVTESSINVLSECGQTSSSDAIQGSELSGVSIQPYAPAAPAVDEHAAAGAEKSDRKMQKAASQNSERSDGFEAPSFTTLVEQGDDSENQHKKETEAGWFPSFTPVPGDSDGREKKEELISEVTSLAGKQLTPLKTLLDEADLEAAAEPMFTKPENLPLPVQNDEQTAKNNDGTVNEWDSPAILGEEIKKEKKKGKGRPYWVQLVCCTTSANY